ncbi:hypothetical protein [Burkholderia plantarii]|uniref:hypothetical protein n=1 Tax=Burkholderia plantarii TaxID=41899 RepID=UPI000F5117AA|nr:hypothetical protein [Burkholderia plantarii]
MACSAAAAQADISLKNYNVVSGEGAIIQHNVDKHEVGMINGVKVSIPEYYLHYGIVYERNSIDVPRASGGAQDQWRPIDNFGVVLRLSDLEPVSMASNRYEWVAALKQAEIENNLLMITFSKQFPIPASSRDIHDDMVSSWGGYLRNGIDFHGLEHFESVQSVDDGDPGGYGHVEYFFDKKSMTTIACHTYRIKVAPHSTFDSCVGWFSIKKFNLSAEMFFSKKDIYRWKPIEDKVKKLSNSFVVN